MAIYFAPLEGFTDAIYRRTHHACFGGVEKYYIPFISPTQHLRFTPRELNAVLPAYNAGVPTVPQVLTNRAEFFLWAAQALGEMGYGEVNLNLGCPSGTVTAKFKGSGMLRDLNSLRAFLDAVFARAPLPISVKTRIGFTSEDEWPHILDILAQYPFYEVIIHPRTREQHYAGPVHLDAFALAREQLDAQLVYNGDVFSAADVCAARAALPGVPLMLGRGLLTNPALARQAAGGPGLTVADVRRFHDALHAAYMARYPANVAIFRLCDAMKYLALAFEEPQKCVKAMRKASCEAEYLAAVQRLLDEHPLRAQPWFFREDEKPGAISFE